MRTLHSLLAVPLLTFALGCTHAPAAEANPAAPAAATAPTHEALAATPTAQPTTTTAQTSAAAARTEALPVTDTKADGLDLTYQRSGGFAGTQQKLVIKGGNLTVTVRGKQTAQRPLTAAESKDLSAKLAKAKASPAPGVQPKTQRRVADAFVVTLWLGDSKDPVIQRDTLDFPATGAGAAWDTLSSTLDGILAANPSGGNNLPTATE